MTKYQSFVDTPVWQEAKNLTLVIYKITHSFPRQEQYGIIDQLRRAAASICANISEGCYRGSTKELSKFLFIARGSCGECICFLILSKELNYISHIECQELILKCDLINKQLNGWIRKISSN